MEREIKSGRAPVHWGAVSSAAVSNPAHAYARALEGLLEVTEGLEHRVQRSLFQLERPTVDALLEALKTKRYTRTKLQRIFRASC